MSKRTGWSPMQVVTQVGSQGLTELLELMIDACDTQADAIRRYRMGPDGRQSATEWEARAILWERCAGAMRAAAGNRAVRELRRALREDIHG